MEIFEEIKSFLGEEEDIGTNTIMPFSLLTKDAVESLRYRAEVILFGSFSLQCISFMVSFIKLGRIASLYSKLFRGL